MYYKILVPSDGSQFSECSLDHLRAIALGYRVPEVILLRVAVGISPGDMRALADSRGSDALSKLPPE
jgi:nucleotide-binding universal stress UspA family protein